VTEVWRERLYIYIIKSISVSVLSEGRSMASNISKYIAYIIYIYYMMERKKKMERVMERKREVKRDEKGRGGERKGN